MDALLMGSESGLRGGPGSRERIRDPACWVVVSKDYSGREASGVRAFCHAEFRVSIPLPATAEVVHFEAVQRLKKDALRSNC